MFSIQHVQQPSLFHSKWFKANFPSTIDISGQTKFTSIKRKLKPIPRRISKEINTQNDLKVFIKKGLKVKHLVINQEINQEDPVFSKPVKVSKNFADIKMLTKSCSFLHSLDINKVSDKDIRCLLKLHPKIRYLKNLNADETSLMQPFTHKALKKFLLRSKHLRNYKKTPVEEIVQGKLLPKNQRLYFTFCMKKSGNSHNYNRLPRFITALSVWSSAVTHVSGNNKSIVLGILVPTDRKSKKFQQDIKMLHHGLNRIGFLSSINISEELEDQIYDFLPLFSVNQLKVFTWLALTTFSKKECKKAIEKFLSRQGARLEIRTSNYSWANLVEMLTLSQQMYLKFGSCFTFPNFTFNFHAPAEVKQALINHFSITETKWEKFTFILKTNSLDWFNEEKRASLAEMMNEILKEKNKDKYSQMDFEIELNDDFSNEFYPKIVEQIGLVIQNCIQDLQDKRITLRVNVQVKNNQNLKLFLNTMKNISARLSLLELKFDRYSSFGQLIGEFSWLRNGVSSWKNGELLKKIKETGVYEKILQELFDTLNKIRQEGCSVNFANNRYQMKDIEDWLSKFSALKQGAEISSNESVCRFIRSIAFLLSNNKVPITV